MKFSFAALLALLASAALRGQQPGPPRQPAGTRYSRWLRIRVTDETGHPLPGAVVKLHCGYSGIEETYGVETDSQGRAARVIHPPPPCAVSASMDGYVLDTFRFRTEDHALALVVAMKQSARSLDCIQHLLRIDPSSSTSLTRVPMVFYHSFAN